VSKVTVENDDRVAGLGDTIAITVNNLKEELARQEKLPTDAERIDLRRYVLFLNDMEVKKLYPSAFDPETGTFRFNLTRSPESKDVWTNLLAAQGSSVRVTKASVGPEGKTELPSQGTFDLKIYDSTLLTIGVIGFVLGILGFLLLARRTSIIRDSSPPSPPQGAFRPYSLARAQVAWWFFIIIGSFLFIALVTQDFDTVTSSSLVLLGIGTGTALGAAMVDANKRQSTNSTLLTLKPRQASLTETVAQLTAQVAELKAKAAAGAEGFSQSDRAALDTAKQQLATKQAELEELNKQIGDVTSTLDKPVSEGFLTDILSDVNGVTFHRLQMIVWTVVLGLIFVWSVWKRLTMPEFSEIVLALMGISAGTYIGFKIPEQQTAPGPPDSTTPAQPATLPASPPAQPPAGPGPADPQAN
jgi:ABC-type Mn2+/Zn2+ transport system permease subunit